MMSISFKGIGDQYVTFSAAGTAELRFGTAGVTMGGYVELHYTGAAPTVGYTALAADGSGGVKVLEGGREYLVVSVDTEAQTVGLFL